MILCSQLLSAVAAAGMGFVSLHFTAPHRRTLLAAATYYAGCWLSSVGVGAAARVRLFSNACMNRLPQSQTAEPSTRAWAEVLGGCQTPLINSVRPSTIAHPGFTTFWQVPQGDLQGWA